MHKDTKQLIKELKKQGFHVVEEGGKHIKVHCPNGSLVILAASPSSHRTIQNEVGLLRKQGFIWKGR